MRSPPRPVSVCSWQAFWSSATEQCPAGRNGFSTLSTISPAGCTRRFGLVQQLGVLIVGPVVAIVAAVTRRFRLALAALIATGAKLVLEQTVKTMVDRQRPATSIGGDVELRGDVPTHGESFPSGHAMLVAALAAVVAPYLPPRWRALPWVFVAIVLLARVYVGAHNPLDVICGAGLGLAIGSCINLALGVPAAGRRSGQQ